MECRSLRLILLMIAIFAVIPVMAYEDEDEFIVWDLVYDALADSTIFSYHPAEELILGVSVVNPEVMYRFVTQHNPDFPFEIAHAYYLQGFKYGIRADVAFCQAIIETGWFKFADGTAVSIDQHNYCGLGVTTRGVKGHSFESVEAGVDAHLQHLYAYACNSPLPEDVQLVDPRFGLVSRGVAPTWMSLSGRWAANNRYGLQIHEMYKQLLEMNSKF